jgi:hypothetical protein
VAAIHGIAGHITEPILISALVAMAIDKLGTRALQDVLALTAPAGGDLALVSREESHHYRRVVHHACRMEEAALGLATFAALSESAESSTWQWLRADLPGMRWLWLPLYRVFLLSDDLEAYRRTMREIQGLASRPYSEAHERWQAFDRSLREHRRGILTALITPAADRCAAAAEEADAWRHLGRLALALEAYRIKKGNYPATLDDLVPDFLPRVPADPLDGQPLRLKRDGKDLLLYSIGRDLKDDGGAVQDPRWEGDLVFRLRSR